MKNRIKFLIMLMGFSLLANNNVNSAGAQSFSAEVDAALGLPSIINDAALFLTIVQSRAHFATLPVIGYKWFSGNTINTMRASIAQNLMLLMLVGKSILLDKNKQMAQAYGLSLFCSALGSIYHYRTKDLDDESDGDESGSESEDDEVDAEVKELDEEYTNKNLHLLE